MTRVRILGFLLALQALYGAYFLFLAGGARERPTDDEIMLGLVSAFFFLAGLGALFPTRPGYYVFKACLYVFLVAFPIGTAIGWATLSYMRRHGLRREFGFASKPAE